MSYAQFTGYGRNGSDGVTLSRRLPNSEGATPFYAKTKEEYIRACAEAMARPLSIWCSERMGWVDEGDEPEEPVYDRLLEELEKRRKKGWETYGTALKPFNGRSAIQDALEECLDQAQYLMQLKMEMESRGL